MKTTDNTSVLSLAQGTHRGALARLHASLHPDDPKDVRVKLSPEALKTMLRLDPDQRVDLLSSLNIAEREVYLKKEKQAQLNREWRLKHPKGTGAPRKPPTPAERARTQRHRLKSQVIIARNRLENAEMCGDEPRAAVAAVRLARAMAKAAL